MLLLILSFMFSLSNCFYLSVLPPINNVYKSDLYIPLIGKQEITIQRTSNKQATLSINGIVNANGNIFYHKESKNEYSYSFDNTITSLLKKYKIEINEIDYDNKKDESKVNIKIKLLNYNKKMIFKNILT